MDYQQTVSVSDQLKSTKQADKFTTQIARWRRNGAVPEIKELLNPKPLGVTATFAVPSNKVTRKERLLKRAGWVRSGHKVTRGVDYITYRHITSNNTIILEVVG